jgi:uncharacterized membrane protein
MGGVAFRRCCSLEHDSQPRNLIVPVAIVASILSWLSSVASYSENRGLLLILYLLLGLGVLVIVLRPEKLLSDQFLTFLIFATSLSLLFSSTLISNNLAGYDIHQEFFMYLQVARTGFWNPEQGLLYNSALSISILPSIISIVAGFSGLWVFKLIFPFLFSFVPVFLYYLYRKILPQKAAFLSVFLFISYPAFYVTLIQLGRQEIAELLVVVLTWIMFTPKISRILPGRLVMILLTLGLITAHYSLAYIYLGLLLFSFAVSHVSRRAVGLTNLMMLLLCLVMGLVWYSFVAKAEAFNSLIGFLSFAVNGLVREFFNPTSRNLVVLQAAGLAPVNGLLGQADRVTEWLVQVCLIIGFFGFAFKNQKSIAERRFLPLIAATFMFMSAAVVLPFFAEGLVLVRIYHIALLFMAPCFAYGVAKLDSGVSVLTSFAKTHIRSIHPIGVNVSRKWSIAATILVLYFLFTSGWLYAVTNNQPTSLILDWKRMATSSDASLSARYYDYYVGSQDIDAALWLKSHAASGRPACADFTARYNVLNSYGEFSRHDPTFQYGCHYSSSYIYLSAFDTRFQILTVDSGNPIPISEISARLATKDTIYANGGATICG